MRRNNSTQYIQQHKEEEGQQRQTQGINTRTKNKEQEKDKEEKDKELYEEEWEIIEIEGTTQEVHINRWRRAQEEQE